MYAILAQAPPEATYSQLIEAVRQATGKGCSRKLISRWKKEQTLSQKPTLSQKLKVKSQKEEAIQNPKSKIQNQEVQNQEVQNPQFQIPNPKAESIQNPKSKIQNQGGWFKRIVAAGAIAASLVGLSFVLTPEDKTARLAIAENPTATETVKTEVPQRRPQALEPRSIKIDLTLTSPQDLKVKPGDEVKPGQLLSDRTTERQRLLNQKQQLQLSLKKLEIPIPAVTVPQPIPTIRELPPVSYQQEEANISLKRQELAEAEQAIANQQEKLRQLQQLSVGAQGLRPANGAYPTSRGNPPVVAPIQQFSF